MSSKADFLNSLNKAQVESREKVARMVPALEKLLEVSRQISTLNLDQAFNLILTHLIEMTQTQRGLIMLIDDHGEPFPIHVKGMDGQHKDDADISQTVAKGAIARREVVIIQDAAASEVGRFNSVLRLRLKTIIAIPLVTKNRVIGVIYTDSNDAPLQNAGCEPTILGAFGAQAAIVLENAQLHRKLQEDFLFLKDPAEESAATFGMIVYQSRGMSRVRAMVEKVLDNDISVLVHGESGTGKELVAHAIHYQGTRKHRPFLAQNTGALPDNLLESELFGHRRGSFSGAVQDKAGIFEVADGGTVFLDEIGEASPAMQVRLLRFLETGTFRRIGDTQDRKSRVRIIAATHRNLEEEVAAGRFRQDLFFRLNVFPVYLPPLRERVEDIPLLVNHFVEVFNRKLGKAVRYIPKRVMENLVAFSWPGNIRELKNTVYRLMVLSSEDALCGDPPWLPSTMEAPASEHEPDQATLAEIKTMEEMEADYIRFVLKRCSGNQTQAAKALGLNRTTLRSRMQKLGLL